jgi:CPA2 family monovalent cation:H+ antiporter-2
VGEAHAILDALEPVILLLLLAIVAAMLSRGVGLSPIVGYLALGLGLRLFGFEAPTQGSTVAILAELGVVFLLFDIGLHFSIARIREQARDIFGFGPVQVLFGTLGLGGLALAAGLAPFAALFVGATLALSSTAVVARLIAERNQATCPVGLTATAVLIFQDLAAILLLIVANALGSSGSDLLVESLVAVGKAAAAFAVGVVLARLVVRPLLDLVANTRNEEVFTATALLVALAAGWATGAIGLSLTLGAFLGGMILAETPYRPIIEAEIKPFRGLLLAFFFISVGATLDPATLFRSWPAMLGVTAALILVKTLLNACASLVFRWSVPGSTQLGFLLAQGSEFAFVILSLEPVRALLGAEASAVLIGAVGISLAATPSVADFGRRLAGRLRQRRRVADDAELRRRELAEPVLIVGMGEVGRTLADGLREFDIGYGAIERDPERFAEASADGYPVVLGDSADPRLWEPVGLGGRRVIALTGPRFEVSSELTPIVTFRHPNLRRFAAVRDPEERDRFEALGMRAIVDESAPRGLDLAAAVLAEMGIEPAAIEGWSRRQQERARGDVLPAEAA